MAIDKYRKKSSPQRIPSEMTVSIDSLKDSLGGGELYAPDSEAIRLGEIINLFLNTLTDREQYIFISRFYVGDTLSSIADELGVNVSTVQRDVERIKRRLKDHLERNDVYV